MVCILRRHKLHNYPYMYTELVMLANFKLAKGNEQPTKSVQLLQVEWHNGVVHSVLMILFLRTSVLSHHVRHSAFTLGDLALTSNFFKGPGGGI